MYKNLNESSFPRLADAGSSSNNLHQHNLKGNAITLPNIIDLSFESEAEECPTNALIEPVHIDETEVNLIPKQKRRKLTWEVQRNCFEHDHKSLHQDRKRLSDEMIDFLYELFNKDTVKISTVLNHIESAKSKNMFVDEPVPKPKQIEYRLKKWRDAKLSPLFKLGDLMSWCSKNSKLPEDDNKSFVFSYESSSLGESLYFRFAVTTKELLKKFIGLETFCVDATYKNNYMGYPMMVLGTVDRRKTFHPLVYGCCSGETAEDYAFFFESIRRAMTEYFNHDFAPKIMIADGADAIRNAFYQVFQTAQIDIMCYAHVIRNIRKRLTKKSHRTLILDDIREIQLAANRNTFDLMTKLFCEKWKDIDLDFVDYFKSQWLGTHRNWYEGAAIYTPSTNNALESHNSVIKRKITLRRRLPLNQFLMALEQLTEGYSNQFSNHIRCIETEPDITLKILRSATQMIHQGFKSFKVKGRSSEILVHLLPSSKCENGDESYYKSLVKRQWNSFDEFIKYGHLQFWLVSISTVDWKKKSTCMCPHFLKNHICKHIIALAIRLNLYSCPAEALSTPLAPTMKKRGRPANARSALIRQD